MLSLAESELHLKNCSKGDPIFPPNLPLQGNLLSGTQKTLRNNLEAVVKPIRGYLTVDKNHTV